MSGPKILVTPRSLTRTGHDALRRLGNAGYQTIMSRPGQQPSEGELLELVPGCVGYLAGVEPITERVLAAGQQLTVISRNGTGVNNIDVDAAERRGITVLRAEGANARGVAELTIGLMLALVRSIPFSDAQLKQQSWVRRQGIEIKGRNLGLIGYGRIGQFVADIASGLGMQIYAFDPYVNRDNLSIDQLQFDSLHNVLSRSDVLSLHCPPTPDGQPLINARTIAVMKDGAYVVNTARGELIEDAAMLDALDNEKLSGLAIDAFRREPPGSDPLVQHPKVIATPHIGAFTVESVSRACEAAVDNLLQFLGPA